LDKQKFIDLIRNQLEADLSVLKSAALATYDAATNEESKPENQYDTRALEASYLAGAQAKRVADIEELIYIYKNVQIKNFKPTEAIAVTALLELKTAGKNIFVFVMPKGGGQSLQIQGMTVQIVTPNSPLGEALLGLFVGDVAQIENGDKVRDYEILSLQ